MTVYIGIDWSQNKHDFTFLSERGAMLAQFTIPHTHEGFLKLEETRKRLGLATSACAVALETAHNLLIDFLWARGYSQVYVVPPKVVNSNRSRYRQSGAHTDQSDSFVLADTLRTDCGVLQPWRPDSLLTRQMRAKVNLISFLTRQILRLHNRLTAVLMRYYPVALDIFSCLSQIGTDFIQAYPTPEAAATLTFEQFVAFAGQHKYQHPQQLRAYFASLQASYPEALPETVQVYQDEAPLLAARLSELVQAKARALGELRTLFKQHPDYAVFSSLPGAGDLLAPALLAMFGDDRQRFPTPVSVQALAGTCPVTQSSGQSKFIHFRWSCNRDFRLIAQQWARASLGKSVWANAYWRQVRPRCKSDSHAYRCLANRWLAILWKLWQLRQPYDETYHCKQRALRSVPLN